MSVTVLNAKKRPEKKMKSYLNKIRKEGSIPVVYYGKGMDSLSLEISQKDLASMWDQKTVNTLFNLVVDGEDKKEMAIVRYVERAVLKRNIIHIDFLRVDPSKKVKVKVPVKLVGESYGVKTEGGLLLLVRKKIEVEALPENIPTIIEVDITPLKKGDGVYVRDVKAGEYDFVTPGTQVIALVEGTRGGEEDEEEAVAETASAE